jgi:hypothetical protein
LTQQRSTSLIFTERLIIVFPNGLILHIVDMAMERPHWDGLEVIILLDLLKSGRADHVLRQRNQSLQQ